MVLSADASHQEGATKKATAKPVDTDVAVEFFSNWFRHTSGLVEIRSFPDGGKGTMCSELDEVRKPLLRIHKKKGGSGWGVCTRRPGAVDGKKESVWEAPGTVIDIDFKSHPDAHDVILKRLKELDPAFIYETGGGYHAGFRFDEPMDLRDAEEMQRWEALNDAFCRALGGDANVGNAAQLLRVPGSINVNYDAGPQVRLIHECWEGNDRDPDDLLERFNDIAAGRSDPPKKPANGNGVDPYTQYGDERAPLDVEQLWADMAPGNIHATQCRIALSMLNHGIDPPDVIQQIVDGTMKRCANNTWVIGEEVKTVRKLVRDGVKKIEVEQAAAAVPVEIAPDDWPDPDDVISPAEVPDIPERVMSPLLEDYVFGQAEVSGGDPGGFMMGLYTTMAACLSNSNQMQVKRNDPAYVEPPIVWTMQVGDPGVMKTGIQRIVTKPAVEIDAAWRAQSAEEVEKWHALDEAQREKETEPVHRCLTMEDFTVEALFDRAKANPFGLFATVDEGAGLFGMIGRYAAARELGDLGVMMKAYEGQSHPMDRKGRPDYVKKLGLTILGNIQPALLFNALEQDKSLGFLQRFQFNMIRARIAPQDRELDPDVGQTVNDALHHMTNNYFDRTFRFSRTAQEVCQQAVGDWRLLREAPALPEKMVAQMDKREGLFARYCLIMHAFDAAEQRGGIKTEVPDYIAERCARLMRQYMDRQSLAFFDYYERTGGSDHSRWVANFILDRGLTEIQPRDLQINYKKLREAELRDRVRVLDTLSVHGWLHPPRGFDQTRPQSGAGKWQVNPKVAHVFRIDPEERERRKQARELLSALKKRK